MQARTFMPCRDIGQAMRSLKVKFFVDFHVSVLGILGSEWAGLSVRIVPILCSRGAEFVRILLLKSKAFKISVFFGISRTRD